MDRRDFLKTAGLGAAALGIGGCKMNGTAGRIEGEMERRSNPGSGDRVGLLGYGCMRWQMVKYADGN